MNVNPYDLQLANELVAVLDFLFFFTSFSKISVSFLQDIGLETVMASQVPSQTLISLVDIAWMYQGRV